MVDYVNRFDTYGFHPAPRFRIFSEIAERLDRVVKADHPVLGSKGLFGQKPLHKSYVLERLREDITIEAMKVKVYSGHNGKNFLDGSESKIRTRKEHPWGECTITIKHPPIDSLTRHSAAQVDAATYGHEWSLPAPDLYDFAGELVYYHWPRDEQDPLEILRVEWDDWADYNRLIDNLDDPLLLHFIERATYEPLFGTWQDLSDAN